MLHRRVQKLVARAALPQRRRGLATASLAASRKENVLDLGKRINLLDKLVLVRVDLNVPLDKKDPRLITDDTRIREALPTVQALRDMGAKVVLCSHLGRPDGKVVDSMRLTPVANRLTQLLDREVPLTRDCVGEEVRAATAKMQAGDVLLLENVRFHAQEEKNDKGFAERLIKDCGAHVFVNDAFGAAHRAHASTAGVAQFAAHRVAGMLMERELRFLVGAMERPSRPLAAVVGGAKVSSKLPVLKNLLPKVDVLAVGGAMAFTFFKAQGKQVGKSKVEDDQVANARQLLKEAEQRGVQLWLPEDVVIATAVSEDADRSVVSADAIPADWLGVDIGDKSVQSLRKVLHRCHTIFWNGPMGVFEIGRFAQGTIAVAKALSSRTDEGAITIVGGGDSVAALSHLSPPPNISHVSTGGGASLELLEGKVLPGVACLDDEQA